MRKDSKKRKFSLKDSDGTFQMGYKENSKRLLTLEGVYYHNMMTRATNPNYKKQFPTYKDVSVSENFKDFQYFANWCQHQIGFGNLGWVLDKDCLMDYNKVYSEDTCCFVPSLINSFLVKRTNSRGLPTGVSWCQSEGKYKAYCSQLNGKNKTLGRFNNPEEAAKSYNEFKASLIPSLLAKFEDALDPRVVLKLKQLGETDNAR